MLDMLHDDEEEGNDTTQGLDCSAVFEMFDTDGDGYISAEDLSAVWANVAGEPLTLEAAKTMISAVTTEDRLDIAALEALLLQSNIL